MTSIRQIRRLLCLLATGLALSLPIAGGANAAPAPVKLQFTGQFGYHVNATEVNNHTGPEHENTCTVVSKDECQTGTIDSGPGAFWEPYGVAGSPTGNIYVADTENHRVQELTATGKFLLMFGREVNETTKGDVCTAEEVASSGVVCKPGLEGDLPESVAVDPVSGDVYVAELVNGPDGSGQRVQKFTAGGQFVLELGREVNETTKGNLCTHEEEVKQAVQCGDPAPLDGAPGEADTFHFEYPAGNILAVGPAGTLYVGEENRVQKLTASGQPDGEITVEPGSLVDAVAVDQNENIYLYDRHSSEDTVRELNNEGSELPALTVTAQEAGAQVEGISGLAVDTEGHLAVAVQEVNGLPHRSGAVYEAGTGRLLSRFKVPSNDILGIGFNGGGQLYAATGGNQEVLAYERRTIAALTTGSASCVPGSERETDAVFNCTLGGEVNPESLTETEAWFQWGLSPALGEQTVKQPVAGVGPFAAAVGVPPDSAFYYELSGEDQNSKAPEVIAAELQSARTPLVAPNIVGGPSALFAGSSSAVLAAQLNPENASSEYFFEYASSEAALRACAGVKHAGCPGVGVTPAGSSAVYAKAGVTLEATGLQPATTYSYRLFAENENEAGSERLASSGPVGSFTTAPEPSPQAQTGPYNNLGTTSATIAATVNPDGASTTYAFELGVYEGANTQFGVVATGTLVSSGPATEETLALTGLQPGTSYAYRISIASGYIENEAHTLQGTPMVFTTSGLPAAIAPPAELAQLPIPSIAIPTGAGTGSTRAAKTCRRGYKRDRHDQCVRSKAKTRKQRATGRKHKKK